MLRIWPVIAVAVAVIIAVTVAQTGAGHKVLQRAGLMGKPGGFTALYFSDPHDPVLPQLFTPEALLDQSFVIRNQTLERQRYEWRILAVRDGKPQQLATGTVVISPGKEQTVLQRVLTSCLGGRLQLVVSLVAPHESVASWTNCSASAINSASTPTLQ